MASCISEKAFYPGKFKKEKKNAPIAVNSPVYTLQDAISKKSLQDMYLVISPVPATLISPSYPKIQGIKYRIRLFPQMHKCLDSPNTKTRYLDGCQLYPRSITINCDHLVFPLCDQSVSIYRLPNYQLQLRAILTLPKCQISATFKLKSSNVPFQEVFIKMALNFIKHFQTRI